MVSTPKKTTPRKRKPAAPKALTLKGSKLEDFLPLLPAEEKLRECAAAGEECVVDDFDGKRPEVATRLNTVRAEFLRYMILGGCEKSPVSGTGISLLGAFIDCAEYGDALDLKSAELPHNLSIRDSYLCGVLKLVGAVAQTIDLDGTQLEGLEANRLHTSGSVYLRNGFTSRKATRFMSAKIGSSLYCSDGHFLDTEKALICDRIETAGGIFLRGGFEAVGEVKLVGARVHRGLSCSEGKFGSGIELHSAVIMDSIKLDAGFICDGPIGLRNARIGGNLICQSGNFNDTNNAIIANRAKIEGNVDLGNVKAKGTIAFTGSEIGGDFMPQGAVLEGTPALQLRNTKISGTLIWRGLGFVDGEVDLSGASCETLNTGNTSWLRKRDKYKTREDEKRTNPDENEKKDIEYHTKLDNFTYNGFSNLPDNCKSDYWIEWLKQQPDDHLGKKFKPRPWEQLAYVLDSMGYEEEARDVRVEKQKLLTSFMINHEEFGFSFRTMWHWLQIFFRYVLWGPLVSYGYRPGNALVWLFGFIIIGTLLYDQAAKQGVMTPTHPLVYKEARANGTIPGWCAENWVYFPDETCAAAMPSEYSEFQPFIYAADVALPVVNLRMEDDWAPRVVYSDGTRDSFGWWVRTFEWFLIAAGWILSLLFVSAVGSSIRR